MPRDYERLRAALRRPEPGDRGASLRAAADALWDALAETGVSWVGFYRGAGEEMVLGPCRDKPACSPIGLHGACGRSWTTGRGLVVRDVVALGEGYIACDPRDRSEVVVPLFDASGCWGVLDLDSFEAGAFDEGDALALGGLMEACGLSSRAIGPDEIDVV